MNGEIKLFGGMKLVAHGLRTYREAREAGMSHEDGKQHAYSELPDLKSAISRIGSREAAAWASGTREIAREHDGDLTPGAKEAADASDENGAKKQRRPVGLILAASGNSNLTKTILAALADLRPAVGDIITLGDLRFWGFIVGASHAAIQNIVLNRGRNTAIGKSGYKFESILGHNEERDFTVRVLAVPRPPEPAPETNGKKGAVPLSDAEMRQLFELVKRMAG